MSGLAQSTVVELRQALRTKSTRWLLVITILLGIVTAAGLAGTASGSDRSFGQISYLVQSTLSLPLPFVAVLMMTQKVPPLDLARIPAKLVASAVVGLVGAVVGIVLSAVAVAVPSPEAPADRWAAAGAVCLGSVITQVMALLVGAGFGLLLRSTVLAIMADVVVPLGLWAILGLTPALRGVQEWLTPFAVVGRLLTGQMGPVRWAQVATVVLVWVVGLNLAGTVRLRRGAHTVAHRKLG